MVDLKSALPPSETTMNSGLRIPNLRLKAYHETYQSHGFLTTPTTGRCCRSEEHTSELQSLMRISYAVFCLKQTNYANQFVYTSLLHQSYTQCCQSSLTITIYTYHTTTPSYLM